MSATRMAAPKFMAECPLCHATRVLFRPRNNWGVCCEPERPGSLHALGPDHFLLDGEPVCLECATRAWRALRERFELGESEDGSA